MKYLKNLLYILRHKWHVFVAGIELGVPLWQLIVHDLSKLLPSEFFPYAEKFFVGDTRPRKMHEPGSDDRFDVAWMHHIHMNKHHFQWWVRIGKDGKLKPMKMPKRYALEMVADWVGAGMAQGQRDRKNVWEWYIANQDSIVLHPVTRVMVEGLTWDYAHKE